MKLRELEASFVKWRLPDSFQDVDQLSEADGLRFLCPVCWERNSGPVGTHAILCWFTARVPPDLRPGPGRWNPQGTGLHDLSFVPPGKPSVQLTAGCMAHFHIVNGEIKPA